MPDDDVFDCATHAVANDFFGFTAEVCNQAYIYFEPRPNGPHSMEELDMTITNQNHQTDSLPPQMPSEAEMLRLSAIFRSVGQGYRAYNAAISSFSADPSIKVDAAFYFDRARKVAKDASAFWLDLTKRYPTGDKPAGWAVLNPAAPAPPQSKLADILVRETGWSGDDAAKVAAVADRTGFVGFTISTQPKSSEWKAETCGTVRDALKDVLAGRRAYADWIVRNIGTSRQTQNLLRAANDLQKEIASLDKWVEVFRKQDAEKRQLI